MAKGTERVLIRSNGVGDEVGKMYSVSANGESRIRGSDVPWRLL